MPLVGSTANPDTSTLGSTTYNVSEYSHSTVYTVVHSDPISSLPTLHLENVPPLTTIFTAPSGCAERWIVPPISTLIIAPESTSGGSQEFYGVAQTGTPFSVFSWEPSNGDSFFDPSFTACQPYKIAPTYSPGVCPDGQTLAEITEYQNEGTSGSISRWWQASCCRSGMSFDSHWPAACISSFTTPLTAYAPLNSTFTLTSAVASDLITVTEGVAIAEPVTVGWEAQDLSAFPTQYASELAKRIGVPDLASSTATTSGITSTLVVQTGAPENTSILTTGAKAGIGIGVSLGVLLIAIGFFLLYLRRKRSQRPSSAANEVAEMEDMDQSLAKRKWFLRGKWRNEVEGVVDPRELDSKTVHVVPGPPAELEAREARTGDNATDDQERPN